MKSGYNTVKKLTENTIIIERSKFICYIKSIVDEEDAKNFIDEVRKKHSLANHNCYAYIADDKGLNQKFSDAGEPQGTAGLPMLEVLKSKKMYKTVAVVTRYFGGVKLGTGGLTRAYGGSVAECLSIAPIAIMQKAVVVNVKPDYEEYSRLLKFISNEEIVVISTVFENFVDVKFAVKIENYETFKAKIVDAFFGKLSIIEIDTGYYDFG